MESVLPNAEVDQTTHEETGKEIRIGKTRMEKTQLTEISLIEVDVSGM